MKLYETAFLIAPNLSEEETEQLINEMAEVVSKGKAKMVNVDKWGKQRLAYPIEKFDTAFYVFFLYEANPEIPTELTRLFKQKESIIRYLTVKKAEGKPRIKRKGRKTREPFQEKAPTETPKEKKETRPETESKATEDASVTEEVKPGTKEIKPEVEEAKPETKPETEELKPETKPEVEEAKSGKQEDLKKEKESNATEAKEDGNGKLS